MCTRTLCKAVKVIQDEKYNRVRSLTVNPPQNRIENEDRKLEKH